MLYTSQKARQFVGFSLKYAHYGSVVEALWPKLCPPTFPATRYLCLLVPKGYSW